MFGVPKYSKVVVNFNEVVNHPNDNNGVIEIELDDCGMVITGNHLILVLDVGGEIEDSLLTNGYIYHLDKVKSYVTHKG
jgi:hypothetical protein